jgi:aspartate/methionine/tyrosine aminotransferase
MSLLLAKRMSSIAPFYVMALLQRAQELEQQGRDIIHMEIGEPDFPTPIPIVNAGLELLKTQQIRYTSAAGLTALREKIAQFYQDTYAVTVASERVFITPGASGAFLLALAATINPDDELLMADPGYPCNAHFLRLFSAQARRVPVDASSHYQLTPEQLKNYWNSQTRGVWCTSPSNPTGTLLDKQALYQLISQTHALGGYFLSDEIYHGLVYGQAATSALQLSDEALVINSFSKYFGMTGWRIGWLIVPTTLIEAVEKLAQNIFIATSTPAQYAALAAFSPETRAELEQRRQAFEQRRDFLYQALIELGFTIHEKPQGAFYIYANCAKFTDDSFQFAHDVLEIAGVAITPGKDFGGHQTQQMLRFAYTTSIERMSEAMARLRHFIQTR